MHKYLCQLGFEPLQCDSCVYRLRHASILLGQLPAFMRTLQFSDIAVAADARTFPNTSWGGDAAVFPATVNWALLGTKTPDPEIE